MPKYVLHLAKLEQLAQNQHIALATMVNRTRASNQAYRKQLNARVVKMVLDRMELSDLFDRRAAIAQEIDGIDRELAERIGRGRLTRESVIDYVTNGHYQHMGTEFREEYEQVLEELGLSIMVKGLPSVPETRDILRAFKQCTTIDELEKLITSQQQQILSAVQELGKLNPPRS